MVRLEGERGTVFVDPAEVVALEPSGIPVHTVVTLKVAGRWFLAKGTPEQVHAALFSEAK